MSTSAAKTVEQYLAELPDDRRELVAAVREVVNANLPDGYQEAMQHGMIGAFAAALTTPRRDVRPYAREGERAKMNE
jgi:hypothetical protein